jgi:dTDP-4-amino-4,6-dideoxygalactose transaminase
MRLIPPSGHKIYLKDLKCRADRGELPTTGFLFNSGTAALYFLLKALNGTDGSSVIIPAYSCPAVASAVIKAGCRPILCDLNRHTLNYNVNRLEQVRAGAKAGAIVWVNLFGLNVPIPDMDLPVILDNAQADPSRDTAPNAAGIVWSFGRGKPVNSLGGGLAVICKDVYFRNAMPFYERIPRATAMDSIRYLVNVLGFRLFFNPYAYRALFSCPFLHLGETIYRADFEIVSMNRLNRMVIQNIMSRIRRIRQMRRMICERYETVFKEFGDEIATFGNTRSFRYPVLFLKEGFRDRICRDLLGKGIFASGLYPRPLNVQPGLRTALNDDTTYPDADYISRNLLTLPVNEFVTDRVVRQIEESVTTGLGSRGM